MSPATRDWDASVYDRISQVQQSWARASLERLTLNGDEAVLDAGCGTGRVTQMLVERVPRGRVVGVDGSPAMIEKARENLGPDVELIVSDLAELSLTAPVDVVFSNATFHWVADHDRLFSVLHDSLVPDGRLLAQCGGRGNVAACNEAIWAVNATDPFAPYFTERVDPWNFAGPKETEERLERAGFADVRCWLEPKTERPQDGRAFAEVVCLGQELDFLPADLHDRYVDAVLELMPDPLTLEYVRLNMEARRV